MLSHVASETQGRIRFLGTLATHPEDAGPGCAVLAVLGVTSLLTLSPKGLDTTENTAAITMDGEQLQLGPTWLLWLLGQCSLL